MAASTLTSRLLKTPNAAKYLNVSQWKIRQLAHRGAIAYCQFDPDGPFWFDRNDLDKFIEEIKIAP